MPWYIKLHQSFVRTNLNKKIGFRKAAFIYNYSTEESSGEWIDHEEKIIIENTAGVTAGDILHSLHHKTDKKLHGQDIMAIEGLELEEASKNNEYPSYHVFFGS